MTSKTVKSKYKKYKGAVCGWYIAMLSSEIKNASAALGQAEGCAQLNKHYIFKQCRSVVFL